MQLIFEKKSEVIIFIPDTPPNTNMDTQDDGLEKVAPLNMAIFGIYVRFLGGNPR